MAEHAIHEDENPYPLSPLERMWLRINAYGLVLVAVMTVPLYGFGLPLAAISFRFLGAGRSHDARKCYLLIMLLALLVVWPAGCASAFFLFLKPFAWDWGLLFQVCSMVLAIAVPFNIHVFGSGSLSRFLENPARERDRLFPGLPVLLAVGIFVQVAVLMVT